MADALSEPPVAGLVSTYSPDDRRLRDFNRGPGIRLLTFASVLKHGLFPLADLLVELLALAREGMGCHVELEFALQLAGTPGGPARFHILQMRPMSEGGEPFDVDFGEEELSRAVCYSSQALGHGNQVLDADIVYVRPDSFDAAKTREIAAEIGRVNARLQAERRPFVLIGPGRWGSFDPWLGIPVKWEDIDGACAIAELRSSAINAEPSQGSHFFQQITSHRIPYLTISEGSADRVRWDLIRSMTPVAETALLGHVRPSESLVIKCNGRTSKCVIMPSARDETIPAAP